jgi:site-specific recombinase XerD
MASDDASGQRHMGKDRFRVGCCGQQRHALLDGEHGVDDANAYLQALALRGLSELTLRAYAYDLLLLYRWLADTRRELRDLTAADLLAFIAAQRQAGAAPRSINRRCSTIRLLHRFHVGNEMVGSGVSLPAPHYKGPGRDRQLGLHSLRRRSTLRLRVKEPSTLVEPLSADQVRAFFARLKRYRDLAIIHLMLFCGLRTCEVLRIQLGDVQIEDARLRIRGKGNRERVMPLPESVMLAIRQYLQLERPARCSHARLFVILQGPRRGAPITPAGVRSLFRQRRSQLALLASVHAHRLRHTFGTDMARAGVRLPVLQKMMGHADAKTTLQYIQLSMADIAVEYRRAIVELDQRYGRR